MKNKKDELNKLKKKKKILFFKQISWKVINH